MALQVLAGAALFWATASGAPTLEGRVRSAMTLATVGGGDAATTQKLDAVQAALAPALQALPKNRRGRLDPEHSQQALRHYFQAVHGWTLAGLEQDGPAAYDGEPPLAVRVQHAASVARHSRGLFRTDLAALAWVIEEAVHDDLRTLLQTAYGAAGHAESETLTAADLERVLTVYLGLLTQGSGSLEEALQGNKETDSLAAMPQIAVKAASAAPFSFDGAVVASGHLLKDLARWQRWRCTMTKATLQGLSTGTVGPSMSSVYRYGLTLGGAPFTQSPGYLRETGALEEPQGEAPRLNIAGYMQGPANCMPATPELSFCCRRACDAHVARVQAAVEGPIASVEQLSALLPAATFQPGDDVEIHGSGFAMLLHQALPEDCPLPATPGSLSTARWSGGREQASAAELAHYLVSWTPEVLSESEAEEEGLEQPPPSTSWHRLFQASVRFVVMVLALGMSVCSIMKALHNASAALSPREPVKTTKKECNGLSSEEPAGKSTKNSKKSGKNAKKAKAA